MKTDLFKIEYGMATYWKGAKKGVSYHITRPLRKALAEKMLQKLNKKYEYTTVWKLKNSKWEII